MPRTKNSKRNRGDQDEVLSTRLRQFDMIVEQSLREIELLSQQAFKYISSEFAALGKSIPHTLRSMTLGDLERLKIKTINEFHEHQEKEAAAAKSTLDPSHIGSFLKKSRDDEGYITEDSNRSTTLNSTSARPSRSRKLPPTFSGLKKLRRSKSACGGFLTPSVGTSKLIDITGTEDRSRSKFRTPLNGRIKSASADRTKPITPKVTPNTPLSLLRYPKAGETVVSLEGSPVVVQSMPDTIANVNIPIENGMISLRPMRMESVDPDLINRIDMKTLEQIKQLQTNLNLLMDVVSDYAS